MKNINYDKYSTEEVREILRQLVARLTDEQCREVLEELQK